MATTVPKVIDDGDLEKYAKQVLANNAAADRRGIDRGDYAQYIGRLLTPARTRVDDGDISMIIKRASLV